VLEMTQITKGRNSVISVFDEQCKKVMTAISFFLATTSKRSKFEMQQKLMMRASISDVIHHLSLLNKSILISCLEGLGKSVNISTKEYQQFCTMTKLGYDLMAKCKKYRELKIIREETINDAMLDVMFSFMDIVLQQLFRAHMNDFSASMEKSSFDKAKSGPMSEFFGSWDNIRSRYEAELTAFQKYMKKTKARCIGGNGEEHRKVGDHVIPDILKTFAEFTQIKWLLTMGRMTYEWKQEHEKSIVYVAFDEHFNAKLSPTKMHQFLQFIEYKNIGMI